MVPLFSFIRGPFGLHLGPTAPHVQHWQAWVVLAFQNLHCVLLFACICFSLLKCEKRKKFYSFTCKVIINKSLTHIHDNDGVPNDGRLLLERREQRLSTEMVVDWWKCIYYDFIGPINYEHTNSFFNLIIICAIEFANY